ncbi:alpha-amylase family glycosyl hydrolase [Oribacterium sinus]|uniref:alpha-amylase family glycosyl hydrolase n=1 Tax=Oribacterium sinus TaxID=237576 RepID=UPI0028E437B6|nr:alpha-amylase family glycosyl hydrolase [Oribacterium sinus]
MGKNKEVVKTEHKKDSLKLEETSGKAKSDNHLEKDYIKAYQNRLAAHMDELKWLYYELYRSNEQSFNYFLSLLDKYAKERDPELRALDQERMKNPRWFKGNDLLGVLMYTNCFAGDLKGVEQKIPYLKECGFNYLHLMPILESPKEKSDGGYAVSNFQKVQPELGTMKDLKSLSASCHKEGISVCLDFVMNHCSEEHEWVKRAKNGEQEFQDRFFMFNDWGLPNEFERTVPQVFPESAPGNFTYCEEAKKVVMTTFYPYQWDLNYGNPTVLNDMLENMLFLCNQGADVFRLDAVPYIWKKLGTNCRNLPEVHTLVRIFRMAMEIVAPGVLLLGEVVMEPQKVVPYFGSLEKPQCHMLYNVTTMASTWHTVATQDTRLMQHQLGQVFALPKDMVFLNYLRCHDDIGWGLDYAFLEQFSITEIPHKAFLNAYFRGFTEDSDARGELYNDDPVRGDARLCGTTASLCGLEAAAYEKDERKIKEALQLDLMLHAFLLSQSGIPVLYSGDEIGQENDYSYHEDDIKKVDSRYLHRGNFLWEKADKRKKKGSIEEKIFTGLKKLEDLRRKHKAFSTMADTWIIDTKNIHVLAFGRYYEGEKILCFYNFARSEQVAYVSEVEDYVDLLNGKPCKARDLSLPAHGFLWLKTSFV